MKFVMYAAMLAVIGCGVRAPVGETQDLVSTQHRLYAHKVADDRYCVFMQDKRDNYIDLLTPRGALNKKQLEKLLMNLTNWQGLWRFLMLSSYSIPDDERVAEDRLAALQVRESHLALTTQRLNKIANKIRKARPSTTSCTETEQSQP